MSKQTQKRILFCIPSLIMGGAEKVLVRTINELGKTHKYQIKLVTYKKSNDMFLYHQIKVPFQYFYNELNEEKPKSFFAKKLWKFRRHQFMKKTFKNADIAIDFLDGGFSRFMLEFPGKRIAWIHSAYTHFKDNIRKDFSNYDALVCLSNSFKHDLENDCPKMKGKVYQIFNAFDQDEIAALAEDDGGIGDTDKKRMQTPYFVHVSRIAADKDLTTLINGYEKYLSKTQNPKKLYIIGAGPMEQFYRDMIAAKGLEQHVQMLGLQENPYPFMKHADALILSSRAEGMSRVVIESMICNTPVIASNCPSGVAEVLQNGACGLLFEPGNADDLCRALIEFENDPKAAQKRCEQAKISLNRFECRTVMKQIEELLDHV